MIKYLFILSIIIFSCTSMVSGETAQFIRVPCQIEITRLVNGIVQDAPGGAPKILYTDWRLKEIAFRIKKVQPAEKWELYRYGCENPTVTDEILVATGKILDDGRKNEIVLNVWDKVNYLAEVYSLLKKHSKAFSSSVKGPLTADISLTFQINGETPKVAYFRPSYIEGPKGKAGEPLVFSESNEEAYTGVSEKCTLCDGTGKFGLKTCPGCHGAGWTGPMMYVEEKASSKIAEDMYAAWKDPLATQFDPRHLLKLGADEIKKLSGNNKIADDMYAAWKDPFSANYNHRELLKLGADEIMRISEIQINKYSQISEKCTLCNGTGKLGLKTCPGCHGAGWTGPMMLKEGTDAKHYPPVSEKCTLCNGTGKLGLKTCPGCHGAGWSGPMMLKEGTDTKHYPPVSEKCTLCNGTGKLGLKTCPGCHGAGWTGPMMYQEETRTNRIRGQVLYYNETRGSGYIKTEDNSETLFVYWSSIALEGYKCLQAGQTVEFEIGKGQWKEREALNVLPVNK